MGTRPATRAIVLISLRENKFSSQGLNRIVFVLSLVLTFLLNGFISFFPRGIRNNKSKNFHSLYFFY